MVVVNPHHESESISPYILEKFFREACQALSIEPPARNGISFKASLYFLIVAFLIYCCLYCLLSLCYSCIYLSQVNYVELVKDAEKNLQRAISEHRFYFILIMFLSMIFVY